MGIPIYFYNATEPDTPLPTTSAEAQAEACPQKAIRENLLNF
jgi:hypothetical protein